MLVVKDKDPTTMIFGYEFDKKIAEILVNEEGGEGLWVLSHIQRTGCAIVQLDSGPHKGIEALMIQEYWLYSTCDSYHIFVDKTKFQIPL